MFQYARPLRSTLAAAVVACLFGPLSSIAYGDVIGEARVLDGDTIDVAGERVRLHGIDAPETRQTCSVAGVGYDCGKNATRMLTGVVNGQQVTCKGDKRDRYGRLIAVCFVGDSDLNARMVRDGWALAYRKYAKDYVAQESEARASGSGMWRGEFLEPWEWRKQARDSH
jgi:endonuclease YncB( thermonuclease family)